MCARAIVCTCAQSIGCFISREPFELYQAVLYYIDLYYVFEARSYARCYSVRELAGDTGRDATDMGRYDGSRRERVACMCVCVCTWTDCRDFKSDRTLIGRAAKRDKLQFLLRRKSARLRRATRGQRVKKNKEKKNG